MVAGKQPFRKPTKAETMTAILNEEPASISQVVPSTPPGLQRVVYRCMGRARHNGFTCYNLPIQPASRTEFACARMNRFGFLQTL